MSQPFGPYPPVPRPPFHQPQWNYAPPPPRYLPPPNFPHDVWPSNLALNIIVTLGIWLLFILGAVVVSPVFEGLGPADHGSGKATVVQHHEPTDRVP